MNRILCFFCATACMFLLCLFPQRVEGSGYGAPASICSARFQVPPVQYVPIQAPQFQQPIYVPPAAPIQFQKAPKFIQAPQIAYAPYAPAISAQSTFSSKSVRGGFLSRFRSRRAGFQQATIAVQRGY